MLYKRVIQLAEKIAGDRATLGKALGLEARTFQGYLFKEREHKLWPLLPDMLNAYPRLSRQWLYFGEGPMLIGFGVPPNEPVPLSMVVEAVKVMAADAKEVDKSIYHYIAGLPADDRGGGSSEEAANEARVRELEAEVSRLRQELSDSKDKIIALYEQLAERQREDFSSRTGNAPTGLTVAPSSPGNEE